MPIFVKIAKFYCTRKFPVPQYQGMVLLVVYQIWYTHWDRKNLVWCTRFFFGGGVKPVVRSVGIPQAPCKKVYFGKSFFILSKSSTIDEAKAIAEDP